VVVETDERGAPAVTGAEGAPRGGARAREATAMVVAVGPGRKTIRWGPRVSKRGRLADRVARQAEVQQGSGEEGPMGGEGRRAGRGWRPRLSWEGGPA
jgi:hypothetical protein